MSQKELSNKNKVNKLKKIYKIKKQNNIKIYVFIPCTVNFTEAEV